MEGTNQKSKVKNQKSKMARRGASFWFSFLIFDFCLLIFDLTLSAQSFTQRGFLETDLTLYPQTAPGDSGQAVNQWLLRYEPSWKPLPWLKFQASFDARTDTHRQVDRVLHLDFLDRGLQQPAFSVRRLSARAHQGRWTVELGKQFIRWGKTDILTPTDRFAPRDYLTVVDNDFLGVTGARLTYEAKSDTIDVVFVPLFTPSRSPLLDQRWVVPPTGFTLGEGTAYYPGGTQQGVRWNHLGTGYEASLSFFDGYNNLPLIDYAVDYTGQRLLLSQTYARIRTYGADVVVPLHWFTLKGETAYFSSQTPGEDEYLQYVVQLERIKGEWSFVGGYAGEYVTVHRTTFDFAPDRGLDKAFLGRAGYTIDATRSVAFEMAQRQNGAGTWARAEYSQTFGAHWRATAAVGWIRGDADDFLGQYRRNSHLSLAMRYSF
jgi:hypothetical protein